MFWVISVYFNIRNTLPKSGTFLLGHPVCIQNKTPVITPVVVMIYGVHEKLSYICNSLRTTLYAEQTAGATSHQQSLAIKYHTTSGRGGEYHARIVTRLRAGPPGYRHSIPGKGKRFFSTPTASRPALG